jgi:hypothetical protein
MQSQNGHQFLISSAASCGEERLMTDEASRRSSAWRRRRLRRLPLLRRFTARDATHSPDPVLLTAFAIDRVGPAVVRASASGVEVHVAAPDEATARVLRAALAETARKRGTDRLVRIVVAEGADIS